MNKGAMTGLKKLVAFLAAIQRSAASGSLMTRGTGSGVLVFEKGMLVRALKEGEPPPSPTATSEQTQAGTRGRALEILKSAAASTEELAFISSSGNAARAASASVASNAGDLILDLVRAEAHPDWVRMEIGGGSSQVRHNTAPPPVIPRLALTPSEGFLMSRADGTMTLDEILTVSPLDEKETLTALYALIAAGLLVAPGAEILGEIPALAPQAGAPAGPTPPADSGVPAPPPAAPGFEPPKRKVTDLEAFLQRTTAPAGPAPSASGPRAARTAESLAEERAALEKRIAECRGADHYAVLGVERTADENAIRRTYYRLAKHFHPDKHRSPEMEELFPEIEAMFAMTTEAYNTLTDEKARAEYDRHIQELASGARPPDADLTLQARESYLRARKHLEAEELFDALRLLETACQLDPSKSDYWLYLGVVQTKNPRWRKKAEASLLKAIDMSPSSATAHLHLARLYKSGGLTRRSHDIYEKVLQWEPTNSEALTELGRASPEKKAGRKAEKKADEGGAARLKSLFKGTKS